MAEVLQSPEFVAATKALGTEMGKLAAVSLDGLASGVERMATALELARKMFPSG